MSDKEALDDLILHMDEIEQKLHKYLKEVNILDILKIDYAELKHSIILSYLFTPYENHNLGTKPLEMFIKKLVENPEISELVPSDLLSIDYSDFVVIRERYSHVDILLKSNINKIVICIENKIYSGENGNQLKVYKNKVNEDFKDYKKVFLYLTPQGIPSSDTDTWHSISYEEILDILSKLDLTFVDKKIKYLLEDYQKVLRRILMNDEELKKICNEIYKKYRQALDLIIENKDDEINEVSRIIKKYLGKKASEGIIKFQDKRAQNKSISFIVNNVDNSLSEKYKGKNIFYIYIEKCRKVDKKEALERDVITITISIAFEYDKNLNRNERWANINEYITSLNRKLATYREKPEIIQHTLKAIELEESEFNDEEIIFEKLDANLTVFYGTNKR